LRDLLGDPTLAADAAEGANERLLRAVCSVPPGTRLAAWVFGIARNVSLELRKARGRAARVIVQEAADPATSGMHERSARSPEAELLDKEALTVVARALAKLPEERRAALLLRLDHGLAYEDIAESMGWSVSKVKIEIFRAREVLRATLEEYRGGSS
jgi:RNA polymerase sigma-70 factor (ECF subfamily)